MAKIYKLSGRGRHAKSRLHALHHFQEWLWPSMGLKRFGRWLFYKIIRHGKSAHALALGFAFGTFASFTPFIGFHMALTLLLCWIFRASYVAGALGTLVGNPWTATPIWLGTYNLGHWVLQSSTKRALPESITLEHLWSNLQYYTENYFLPMTVGGVILGTVFGLIFYYPLRFHIEKWRHDRHTRLHAKTEAMKKAS